MNNKFTVEEVNLICIFECKSRTKVISDIKKVIKHLDDGEMVVINARYNNRTLRTIFSGERGLNEIMELDEAMGSRIYQRCGKYKLKIGWGEGRNYRTREEGVV